MIVKVHLDDSELRMYFKLYKELEITFLHQAFISIYFFLLTNS